MAMLPASNPAGNNQTGPRLGGVGAPQPIFQPVTSNPVANNPYLSSLPASGSESYNGPRTPQPVVAGAVPGSATYDPTSHYSGGQTDINKQLIDILGKGVGGSLDYLLKNMSGNDSAIFQQWFQSMQPERQAERAALDQRFGAEGISANSSVSAIGHANLEAQFGAQDAGENAHLMDQSIQDTIGILTGLENPAIKEVASSGWTTFANVMNNITGDIGNLFGGSYQSPQAGGAASGAVPGAAASDPMNTGNYGYAQPVYSGTLPNDPSIPEQTTENLFG